MGKAARLPKPPQRLHELLAEALPLAIPIPQPKVTGQLIAIALEQQAMQRRFDDVHLAACNWLDIDPAVYKYVQFTPDGKSAMLTRDPDPAPQEGSNGKEAGVPLGHQEGGLAEDAGGAQRHENSEE